ncbi:SH3-containing GRB2-like protein 3-interacting protein 1 isoform X1 [Stegostoma tigrinum]|uniref:SH3-containing GRB2-like protein 3-interacting protein 1 isoform X1 n=2 Tax=Stegostoma tigrinum TaxID=3053191 RepID=UPI002870B232|nr:SH3-containing GRB2-like protein 3-interacting protein 1 isoform X1 [Stegostoma tigrinum]
METCLKTSQGPLEIEECYSATMMEGLKKRTRKAFGIRKKEKDTDSTGSPDRDGTKKSNGAPNGFYAEIDWERYNSPEVDDEGYSIRPDDKSGSTKEKHFYSSSESESEEDTRRKFNIKIRPLQAKDSILCVAASVDELKASVGNISLSPSPMRRSPAIIKRNLSSEEIARPRRSTPTSEVVSSKKVPEDTASLIPLFGPPLESAFEGITSEAVIDQPEIWGPFEATDSERQSSLSTRSFPIGTPPPLPPKHVPATPPRTGSPSAEGSDHTILKGTKSDLDAATQQALPNSALGTIGSDQGKAEPQPDKLLSISDLDDIFGPVVSLRSGLILSKNKWIDFSDQPASDEVSPVAWGENKSLDAPPSVSVPLDHDGSEKKSSEQVLVKNEKSESSSSLKELAMVQKTTPPPPPPPTYRTVVSSPGPSSGSGVSNSSGSSSPARPATPLNVTSNTPPPPPPRPPSRPKLPPGKPSVTDMSRSFSPPIHSSSPPPVAPLARAESTSSISSTNSLSAATTPTVENDQPSLVWFDRGKFYLTFDGASRGPSPLTMGAQDTLPVAAAFTETVNAYFKGADPSKCIVKITGEMVLSFPAGITRHFANNQCPAILTFCITNCSRLEHILPNPQLLCSSTSQGDANTREFWVNMPNLMTHLKKVAEQKPSATYYNVDMLKYQVSSQGIQSTPLNLAVSWRCEPTSTDLRIDYKYNAEAMVTPVALNNVQFLTPVDGGVAKVQAVLPPAAWNAEQHRILWKIPDISQKSENGGVGSLLARFQLSEGPSKPATLAVQFTSEGSTLSGVDIELVGAGYRFSLIKKRFAAGKYMADN